MDSMPFLPATRAHENLGPAPHRCCTCGLHYVFSPYTTAHCLLVYFARTFCLRFLRVGLFSSLPAFAFCAQASPTVIIYQLLLLPRHSLLLSAFSTCLTIPSPCPFSSLLHCYVHTCHMDFSVNMRITYRTCHPALPFSLLLLDMSDDSTGLRTHTRTPAAWFCVSMVLAARLPPHSGSTAILYLYGVFLFKQQHARFAYHTHTF